MRKLYPILFQPVYRTLCVLTFLSLSLLVQGQSNTNEVIGSAGQQNSTGNAQVSWTIGEGVTQTFVGSSDALTQGFHQPDFQPQPPQIPTLSEWGLICLGLLIACFGAAMLWNRKNRPGVSEAQEQPLTNLS